MNITPNSSEKDIAGALEIVKHLTDGPLYEKRLAELRGVAAAAESKLKDALSLGEKYKAAEQMVRDAATALSGHRKREEDMNDRERVLAAREGAVAKAELEYQERKNKHSIEMADREGAVAVREKDALVKHDKLDRRETALNDREADIAGHHAKIKDFAKSLAG